jgi:hypothetical protein
MQRLPRNHLSPLRLIVKSSSMRTKQLVMRKEALHWRLAIDAIIGVKKRGTECGGGKENTW